jgi:hypothetical protein
MKRSREGGDGPDHSAWTGHNAKRLRVPQSSQAARKTSRDVSPSQAASSAA